jgi:transketolase
VVAPGDPLEAEAATEAIAAHDGPCYLRLGRAGEANVHRSPIHFQLGKAIQVRAGNDITLISTGGMLQVADEICGILLQRGLQARLLSMHTVKPLDEQAVLAAARETGAIFTLEEHSVVGGLGSAVAELLAESEERDVIFRRFGLPPTFSCKIGAQEYLRAESGLSVESLAEAICAISTTSRAFTAAAQD